MRAVEEVRRSDEKYGSLLLVLGKPLDWKISEGDSVAVNGVCLTATAAGRDWFSAEAMPATLRKTTFGFGAPERVNLETSLGLSDKFGGHFVQGHIDAVGKIAEVKKEGRTRIFAISFPVEFSDLIAPRGAVAVNGVSLTVLEAGVDRFSVALTDHTLRHTTFGKTKARDLVNLEFDMFAKYVRRALELAKERDDPRRKKDEV